MSEATGLMAWGVFVLLLVLCFGAAATGAIFRPGAWYAALEKPAWTPPRWMFPVAWTALYLLMAISAFLVWQIAGWPASREALGLFVLQLVLNAAWSWLFFGLHRPGLALLDVVALWMAIFATMVAFSQLDPLAGPLLFPYLVWVTFAGALNFSIWRRN